MVRFATLCSPLLVAALLLVVGPGSMLYAQDNDTPDGQRYTVFLTPDVDVDHERVGNEFSQYAYNTIERQIEWRGPLNEVVRDRLLDFSRDSRWRDAIEELWNMAGARGETEAGEHEDVIESQSYHEQPLNNVLRDYAELFELNIVLSRGITGEVTVTFRNVGVMDALEAILESQDLAYERIENQFGDDVFLIVPYEERPPEPQVSIFEVPWPDRHLVDIDFEELVQDMEEIIREGRVISNLTSRIVLIEAQAEEIDLARRYLQLVLENLPERDLEVEDEDEDDRPDDRPDDDDLPEREEPRRELFRLNPEPNFFEQAMEELTRLLGARPEVISERNGVFVIEDTPDNLSLAAEHIAFLDELRPDEDRVDPMRLETRSYTLKQNAEEIADRIEEFLSEATDEHPEGRLVVNRQLNSVMITDTVKNLAFLERYIRELDATPQQVLIESTILEATLDDSTEFGVQSFFQRDAGSGTIGYQNLGYDPGGSPAGESAFRSFSSSAYNLGFVVGNEWEVALQAIQTTLDANILSRPKLVVANGREGEIEVGTVIPFIDVAGGAAGASQGVSFRDVLLRMSVVPHIEPGDRIRLELEIEFDARVGDAQLGGVGAGVPIISSRSVRTEVYINDAETLVIGGLYEERESNTVNRVPVLGDVPVLGALFRQTSLERQKTDLLFLITPTIVRDLTMEDVTHAGRALRVFRPEGPQIPDWYDDRNYTRLRGEVD